LGAVSTDRPHSRWTSRDLSWAEWLSKCKLYCRCGVYALWVSLQTAYRGVTDEEKRRSQETVGDKDMLIDGVAIGHARCLDSDPAVTVLPHIAAILLVRPRWNPTPDLMKAKFNRYRYQYLLAVSIKRSAGGRTWQLPDCQNGRSIKDWFIRYCTLANDTKHSDGSITERGGVPYR
jgi:hypothetical protein